MHLGIRWNVRWRIAVALGVTLLMASPVWADGRHRRARMDSAVA